MNKKGGNMPVNYLKKGSPVLYTFYYEDKEKLEYFKKKYETLGIKLIHNKEHQSLTYEGFIAGDTKARGLSVIALENTDYCFIQMLKPENAAKIRKLLRNINISITDIRNVLPEYYHPSYGQSIKCQFKI